MYFKSNIIENKIAERIDNLFKQIDRGKRAGEDTKSISEELGRVFRRYIECMEAKKQCKNFPTHL